MGFNFDEAKKKLNLDETLDKVAKVVKDTVDQIDDVIEKGRETLTEKLEPQRGEETTPPAETPDTADTATSAEATDAAESATSGPAAPDDSARSDQPKPNDFSI